MGDLVTSLEERKSTWDRYEDTIKVYHKGDQNLSGLYSLLIQAALFSEMGISVHELESNLNCSNYVLNQLMDRIPQVLIDVRKKGNRKFYSMNLNELDERIFQEKIAQIEGK